MEWLDFVGYSLLPPKSAKVFETGKISLDLCRGERKIKMAEE
jgi:hypothetical protein